MDGGDCVLVFGLHYMLHRPVLWYVQQDAMDSWELWSGRDVDKNL